MGTIPGYPTSYLLEVQKGGQLQRAISLGYVTRLERVNVPAHTITYTLGKLPVREHSGNRFQTFAIQGRSGLRSRRQYQVAPAKGSGRTEDASTFGTGPELFRNLVAFLEQYEEDARKYNEVQRRAKETVTTRSLLQRTEGKLSFQDQAPTANPIQQEHDRQQGLDNELRLVFRALDERLDVLVESMQLQWVRASNTSRHSYEWNLSLQGYGLAQALEKPFGVLGTVAEQGRKIAKMIDKASETVAMADDALKQVDKTLDAIKEPLRSVSKIGGVMESLGSTARGVANWPSDFAATWMQAAEDSAVGILSVFDSLDFDTRSRNGPAVQRIINTLREAKIAARVAMVATGNAKAGRSYDPTASVPRIQPSYTSDRRVVKTHPVKGGETLYDIAQQLLDTRVRWVDLMELNGLSSPFMDPRGIVLQPGIQLIAPLPPDAELTENEIEDLYGTDLRLDFQYTDEGLQVDLLPLGTEDIQLVSGPDNLSQALTMRLLTKKGDNTVFPAVGLPELVGEPNTAESVGHFAAHVRTQMLSDPRIAKLGSLEVTDDGDGLTARAKLETVEGSSRVITVPTPR